MMCHSRKRPYTFDQPVVTSGYSNFSVAQPPPAPGPYIHLHPSTVAKIILPFDNLLTLDTPATQEFIRRQGAEFFGIPYDQLLRPPYDLPREPKRSRLEHPRLMAPSYPQEQLVPSQEKAIVSIQPDPDGVRRFQPLDGWANLPGFTPGRISSCLAGFCGTSDEDYESPPVHPAVSGPALHAPALHDGNHQVSFQNVGVPGMSDIYQQSDAVVPHLPNWPALEPMRRQVQPAANQLEALYTPVEGMSWPQNFQGPQQQLLSPTGVEPFPDPAMLASIPCTRRVYEEYEEYEEYDLPSGNEVARMDAAHSTLPVGSNQPRLPTARRKPFKDKEQREKTARTRKIGSCIRCRFQRVRCIEDEEEGPGAPCLACKKLLSSHKPNRMGCVRWKIPDVQLFKPGQVQGLEWTNRWRNNVADDIGNWDSAELRVIRVTEGLSGKSVQLTVRRFVPQEGDKVKRSWVSKDGTPRSVDIPPYAITNLEDARVAFNDYIKAALVQCCEQLLAKPSQVLLAQTYRLAIRTAKSERTPEYERGLLSNTLDLWMSIRLTTNSFEIIGEETLGMSRSLISDISNPLHGKVPLPPVMGAQIDAILIHQVQNQLRRRALDVLQKMICDRKVKTWLTQYLVIFVLLHNIGLVIRHDAEYAKKHGIKRRFAREERVREYDKGANTLLTYFHNCNRGMYPFSSQCRDEELRTLADLDEQGIEMIKYTKQFAANHKAQWQRLRAAKSYEDEYFYVSQLFCEDWSAELMDYDMEAPGSGDQTS